MNKIILRQSAIVINDYDLGDEPRLEKNFTVYDPMYHTTYTMGVEYDELGKRLYLPRGLDINYIEGIFGQPAIVDRHSDKYDIVSPTMLKVLPRDDTQYEIISFLAGESKYFSNKAKSQLACNAGTGKGKSYCTIATASYLKVRTMIIASSTSVLTQWGNYIQEYTDAKSSEIYMITGSPSVARLYKKDISKYKYILCTHSTLLSYGKTFGFDKISELFSYLKIGLKIFDEAHENFDNICRIDFHTNTYKTIYLTATPSKSNIDEDRIYQLYFKNIPAISLFDPENDPHTTYIAVKYKSHPSPYDISACTNQYGLNRVGYTDYIVNNSNFLRVVHFIMRLAFKQDGKCLFYIGTNNAIQIIYDWLYTNYPEIAFNVGIYTSITPADIKEAQLNKKIILSTTKSCGAAMDIKGLKMTVVLAEPFKSEVLARQTLGRTRAANTYYIEIVDMSFNQIKRFYAYKKLIFNKYALDCQEIVLDDSILRERYDSNVDAMQRNTDKKIDLVSFS